MSTPPSPRLGCIADDFTGATDLANNLVRSGMRTVQTIGVPDESEAPGDVDAIVVALKSRTVAPQDAVAASLDALRWLQGQGVEQVYFKYCSTFDSTPAGNIGPVTDALLAALDSDFTIACPAFPENQRTIFKGHLFVGDVLLSDSGMRTHPLTPMTDANLVRVLQPQTTRKVGLVTFDVVARGADAIRERFAALRADGVGIAVVDAISNEDLRQIGAACAGMALVTAGSGVAIGLPRNWSMNAGTMNAGTMNAGTMTAGSMSGAGTADRLPPASGHAAVVSGSCSQATNAQVRHFVDGGSPGFAIEPLRLAAGEDLVASALAWAAPRLADGPVLIYATAEPDAVKAVQEQLGVARAGEIVEEALSAIALGLVERGVRRLVVAGGETSGAVVQKLGVRQMTIGPQIDPGVPWTAARATAAGDALLHVALKSGNFGTPDFFTKAFGRLDHAA